MEVLTNQVLMPDRHKVTAKIIHFWDQLTIEFQKAWSEHFQQGAVANQNLSARQNNSMERLAAIAAIKPQQRVLDVGCGIGQSSVYLAEQFKASVTGTNISPSQVNAARKLIKTKPHCDVRFILDDAHFLRHFVTGATDIVWSLGSCEQLYDKAEFLEAAHRVLKPGGKLVLATACSAYESFTGAAALDYQQLCTAFHIPYLPSAAHYQKILGEGGFTVRQQLDWTADAANNWDTIVSALKTPLLLETLRSSPMRALQLIHQFRLMRNAYQLKRIQYVVLVAEKNS
jgi:tocopherol O-methyltransferase